MTAAQILDGSSKAEVRSVLAVFCHRVGFVSQLFQHPPHAKPCLSAGLLAVCSRLEPPMFVFGDVGHLGDVVRLMPVYQVLAEKDERGHGQGDNQ